MVGLGNPGDAYLATRHNVGFRVVERFVAERFRSAGSAGSAHSEVGRSAIREACGSRFIAQDDWVACQPQTYMNRSGNAVRCFCERHGLSPESVLVIFDDIHLPLGKIRLRSGGSAAGHRGLESVIESLQTEAIPRLRLGVGAPPPAMGEAGLAEYVLAPFLAEELAPLEEMIGRAARAVGVWLDRGMDAAMNAANSTAPSSSDLPIEAGNA
ncbi:MAG: aminoacyl-tRNA hydrolase [Thermoanaerobaculia bacterium]